MIGLPAIDAHRLTGSALQQPQAPVRLAAAPFASLLESVAPAFSVGESHDVGTGLPLAPPHDPAVDSGDLADATAGEPDEAVEPDAATTMSSVPTPDVRPSVEMVCTGGLISAPPNLPPQVPVTETVRSTISPDLAAPPSAERPLASVGLQNRLSPPVSSRPNGAPSPSMQADGKPQIPSPLDDMQASETAIDNRGGGFMPQHASPSSAIQPGGVAPQVVDRPLPFANIDGRQPVAEPSAARDTVVLDTLRAGADLDVLAIEIGAAEAMVANGRFRIATDHLGVLGIGVAPSADGMSVQIAASDADRAAFITAAQPQLVDEMRAQGIRLSGSNEPSAQYHNPSPDRGRPQWHPTDVMPSVDEFEPHEPAAERHYRLA